MELTFSDNLFVLLVMAAGMSTFLFVGGFIGEYLYPAIKDWWAWRQAKKAVKQRAKAARGIR